MGSWVTDGSKGFIIDGKILTKEATDGMDDIFNAIWKEGEGVSSGRHYWKIKVTIIGNGVGVGLTSSQHLKMGYECKSLMYSGDLSIGARYSTEPRLVADFGPKIKDNDTVGILAVFEGVRLKMYVDVNGTSLGLAFDVPASTFKSIYPVVSFYFAGTATCTKQTVIPENMTTRARTPGIEGRWILAKYDDQLIPYPVAPDAAIWNTGPDTYKWSIKKFQATIKKAADGTWKSEALVMPGRRSPRKQQKAPKAVETEQKMMELMRGVRIIALDTSDNLTIKSATNQSLWVRPKAPPFVGQPFDVVPSSSTSST